MFEVKHILKGSHAIKASLYYYIRGHLSRFCIEKTYFVISNIFARTNFWVGALGGPNCVPYSVLTLAALPAAPFGSRLGARGSDFGNFAIL